MKVPAWEFWSNDTSWGMRELDTRKIREGASIEEAYSNTAYHIDMGCHVSKSDGDDAKIVGGWLKEWAWNVGIGMLLNDHYALAEAYDDLATEMNDINNVADRLVVTRLEPGKS